MICEGGGGVGDRVDDAVNFAVKVGGGGGGGGTGSTDLTDLMLTVLCRHSLIYSFPEDLCFLFFTFGRGCGVVVIGGGIIII